MKNKNKNKIGIADAYGIESYIDEVEKKIGMFVLRAGFNRQRHAIAYKAVVSEEVDKRIEVLLKKQDFIGALKYLKANAVSISLASGMGNVQKSFDLIPNPKLDPYN